MTSHHDQEGDIEASSPDAEVIHPSLSTRATETSHHVPVTGPNDELHITSQGVDPERRYNDNNRNLYTERSVASSALKLSRKFQKGRYETKPDDTCPQGELSVLRPCHQGDTMCPSTTDVSQHRQVIPLKRKVSNETSILAHMPAQRPRRACRDKGGSDLIISSKSDHSNPHELSHSQSAIT
jgi:hypothetical protein